MSKVSEYIERELAKGFSKTQITEKLKKAGYNEEQMKQGFNETERKDIPKKTMNNIQRKKVMFVVGVLVAVGLLITLMFLMNKKIAQQNVPLAEKKVPVDTCNKFIGKEKDICILKLAKEYENAQVCKYVDDKIMRQQCSIKGWDNNPCFYSGLLGASTDACYLQKALKEKALNKCYMTKEVNDCLLKLTLQENNISYCNDEIECVKQFVKEKEDITICNNLDESAMNVCKQTITTTRSEQG